MLSSTANLNSFYSVSKGIRRETLLKLSRIKSLLPENLPRVNKTYFTTNSKNLGHIFSRHFDSQILNNSKTGKVVAQYIIEMDKCDIITVIKLFNSSYQYFVDVLIQSYNIHLTKTNQNLIFYFFIMNEEFFVRASVRLIQVKDISGFNNFDKVITLYNDPTITNIIYMGAYVKMTEEKDVKEEYYQKIKISI